MPSIMSSVSQYKWADWVSGILKSFISGGSAAVVSAFTTMGISPEKYNLNAGLGNTMKLAGIMFLAMGVYRLAEFLTIHAVPDQVAAAEAMQNAQVAAKETVAAIADAKDKMAPKD